MNRKDSDQPKLIPTAGAEQTFIRNCAWGYRCEKTWDTLVETSIDQKIRFCDSCEREVHLCLDKNELAEALAANHCVAFDERLLNSSARHDNKGYGTEPGETPEGVGNLGTEALVIGELNAPYSVIEK